MKGLAWSVVGIALLATTMQVAAQTCSENMPLTKPDSRYVAHNDGTVTDTATGLMWKQCAEGQTSTATPCDSGSYARHTWGEALELAGSVNAVGFAGHQDWRLPNVKELVSLTEWACHSMAINTTFFPETPTWRFWSSSPGVAGYVWVVIPENGHFTSNPVGGFERNAVRLVRSVSQ